MIEQEGRIDGGFPGEVQFVHRTRNLQGFISLKETVRIGACLQRLLRLRVLCPQQVHRNQTPLTFL